MTSFASYSSKLIIQAHFGTTFLDDSRESFSTKSRKSSTSRKPPSSLIPSNSGGSATVPGEGGPQPRRKGSRSGRPLVYDNESEEDDMEVNDDDDDEDY